jgi:hypothetical protein
MKPYKYFALIVNDKIVELIQSVRKPDISYLNLLADIIEITPATFCDLAYLDSEFTDSVIP